MIVGVLEEIEPADFVRAIVRAIARADAAVVNLQVQPFVIVERRADRADQFAGRVFALHARHRLMAHRRVVRLAAEISVNADPLHFAARGDLVLADHRDVVLCLAGEHAGVAADAGRQVNGHAPSVTLIAMLAGIEERLGFFVGRLGGLPDEFAGSSEIPPACLRDRFAAPAESMVLMRLSRHQRDSFRRSSSSSRHAPTRGHRRRATRKR